MSAPDIRSAWWRGFCKGYIKGTLTFWPVALIVWLVFR